VGGGKKRWGAGDEGTGGSRGGAFGPTICPRTHAIVALSNIDFDLYPGEVLGIVGESGSGKSTLVQLLYFDQEPTSGDVNFRAIDDGRVNLLTLSNQRKRHARNHLLGMVYQNPRDGLNFGCTAGATTAENLLMAGNFHVGRIRGRATSLLEQTEVPVKRMDELPSTFSGGMQQRVQISKAIANRPPLVFMDEVTSGLDV